MLSFGVGMQENIAEQFDKFGLLSIIQVYPSDASESDSTEIVQLDNTAIEYLEKIPGVELVYPLESFELTVSSGDSVETVSAQTLPLRAVQTKLFSNLAAGSLFSSDSSKEVMISGNVLEALGIESVDSIIDKPIIVSIQVARIDSGVAALIRPLPEIIRKRGKEIRSDSLHNSDYTRRAVREELSESIKRFVNGFMNNRQTITDTLVVCGVLQSRRGHHLRLSELILPVATARRFSSSGFSGNPTDILAYLQSGNLLEENSNSPPDSYSRVTVMMEANALYEPIRNSIDSAGFRTFSFA